MFCCLAILISQVTRQCISDTRAYSDFAEVLQNTLHVLFSVVTRSEPRVTNSNHIVLSFYSSLCAVYIIQNCLVRYYFSVVE